MADLGMPESASLKRYNWPNRLETLCLAAHTGLYNAIWGYGGCLPQTLSRRTMVIMEPVPLDTRSPIAVQGSVCCPRGPLTVRGALQQRDPLCPS